MRDFSGKGSLWCVNPSLKTSLAEWLQRTPVHQLNSLRLLQDVCEAPKPSINNYLKTFRARSTPKTNGAAYVNPKLVVTSPKITKTCHQSRSASQTLSPPDSDSVTEMDAVNALLTMKSRASSLPACAESRSNEARPGRRKQLFKRPTKKSFVCFYDDDDDEEDREIKDLSDDENQEFSPFDEEEEISSEFNEKEDEEDEDTRLQIDESFQSGFDDEDDYEDYEEGECIQPMQKKPKLVYQEKNALLELSRAAILIEEQKDQKNFTKQKSTPKKTTENSI